MRITNWLHRLLNPHCHQCKVDSECVSCAQLAMQLANERQDKQRILDHFLGVKPQEAHEPPLLKEMKPKSVPWAIKRAQLEREDRQRAQELLDTRNKTNEQLERELGINNDDAINHARSDGQEAIITGNGPTAATGTYDR